MKSQSLAHTILGILVFALAGCGGSQDAAPPSYDFSETDGIVEAFLEERPAIEGAGLIIVHQDHGVVHHRAYGDFTLDRISLVASSSKIVTAGILMALQDQGLLDIDEPIEDFLGWESLYPVTTAQLLSNSSGLVGLGPDPTYRPYLCQYIWAGDLMSCGMEILTTPDADANVIQPDTAFRYGGGQWQVAGAVAEAVSGKSWAELFDEVYRQPCGLEFSGYNNHFAQLLETGRGNFDYPLQFAGDPNNLLPTENPNMEGGLYTTTGDYGKLLEMHLNGGRCENGRVLSEASVERMQENRIFDVWGGRTGTGWEGYGLGWWVDTDAWGVRTDGGAYGSFPWLDRDRRYAAFLVLEASAGLGTNLGLATVPSIEDALENPM